MMARTPPCAVVRPLFFRSLSALYRLRFGLGFRPLLLRGVGRSSVAFPWRWQRLRGMRVPFPWRACGLLRGSVAFPWRARVAFVDDKRNVSRRVVCMRYEDLKTVQGSQYCRRLNPSSTAHAPQTQAPYSGKLRAHRAHEQVSPHVSALVSAHA